MRIKLFTMVKDEIDIIRDWIIYHGCMFGWDSIYVIDNFSTDGTYEIIDNVAHERPVPFLGPKQFSYSSYEEAILKTQETYEKKEKDMQAEIDTLSVPSKTTMPSELWNEWLNLANSILYKGNNLIEVKGGDKL
jgi:hypothetical protein